MSDIDANKAIVRCYFETFNAGSPTAVHTDVCLEELRYTP